MRTVVRITERLLVAFLALSSLAVIFIELPVTASATNVACVVINVDTCTVTISLSSNMDEPIGSTMPDTQPWSLNVATTGSAPYTLMGIGSPPSTWNGIAGATNGTVWAAVLTTGANEPSGALAILTFDHVTPASTTTTTLAVIVPYESVNWSYTGVAPDNGFATIMSSVLPRPARGDVILQRKSGTKWVRAGILNYNASVQRWIIKLKWGYPKRARETFRILAVATARLSATYGGDFQIATMS